MINRHLLSICFLVLCFSLPSCLLIHAKANARNSFIENSGQIIDQIGNSRNDIDFKVSTGKGLSIFISNNGLHYQWSKTIGGNFEDIELYRMDVKLLGSNSHAKVTVERPLPYREYYYLPLVSDRITINAFEKITYHEIYPNIDWVLYFHNGKLEHDFVIRKGGKTSDIKLQYMGGDKISLNKDGGLHATTPLGEITEHAPIAYQQSDRKKIAASFTLNGDVLSFSTAPHNGTLVIDPIIDWGTYYGGTEYDDLRQVRGDGDGFVYAVGSTNSISNIATTGAYQIGFAGGSNYAGSDAILCKFNASGTLIWSTYYGGAANDVGKNVEFDTAGNIYIAGYTNSTDGIATAGAYQTTKLGSTSRTEAFLVKFDTSGQRIWGTYFGGTQNESNIAMSLCSDKSDHLYLTGNTNSISGISTAGAYQATPAGGADVFLAQFSTSGSLNWSTYYGGSGDESPYSVACDTSGNIYITGSTIGSGTGIATAGSFQTTYDPVTNGEDAFLAKFSPSGQLQWGTYYGNTALDRAYALTVDSSGVYIAGVTLSTNGIATIGSHQSVYGGGAEDGFVAKFNATGQRQWASYYGSTGGESISGLAYMNGSLYLTGYTNSVADIATPASLQPVYNGGQDGFISKMDATNGLLLWGSYLGGVDAENGYGIDASMNGDLLVCGATISASGISTPTGYQTSFGGGDQDGFLIKIKDCIIPQINGFIEGDSIVCTGSTHEYTISSTDATSYGWIMADGWLANNQGDNTAVTFNGDGGILKAVAINDCYHGDTVSLNITVDALPAVPVIERAGNQLKTTQVFADYQWYRNGVAIAGSTSQTYTLTGTGDYTVAVFNEAGCSNMSASFAYTETGINGVALQNGIMVYPNPVHNLLSIKLASASKLEIIDLNGKILESKMLQSGLNSLEIQQFSTGLYLVRLSDPSSIVIGSCKIIKQ